MIFKTPTPWKEAIGSRDLKQVMPTDLSSAELSQLPAQLRERAMFSARTMYADYLQQVNDLITRIVSPEGAKPGEYMNPATARLEMKETLQSLGYQPDPVKRGTLQDLSSDARLNLIVTTTPEMAQGFGNWFSSQDPSALEAFPAQELYRLEEREQHRPWRTRWSEAGGILYNERMIALKNDPVWEAISDFELPYPPFAFGSGMWVRDISYAEAAELGVITSPDEIPDPDKRGFNDDLQTDFTTFAEPLQEALQALFKGGAA